MEAPPLERKLVAILAADVASYSRMMEVDEEGTLATLSAFRSVTDRLIAHHEGRICGTAGDSILEAFGSALAAEGKAVLYISHVLEVVEQICGRVIVIAQGKICANAAPSELTQLMHLPSLESVFAQLVQQQDTKTVASEMIEVMRATHA